MSARTLPLLALLGIAGCLLPQSQGTDGGGPDGAVVSPSPSDGDTGGRGGREVFDARIRPIVTARCAACHADGGFGPPFLKSPDAYLSLLAWPGIVTRQPARSRLLTKGEHNGAQYFTDAEKLLVLDWLAIEVAALSPSMTTSVATPPMTPVLDGVTVNTIWLDPLGPDFLGARVTFVASRLESVLRVTDVAVQASGPAGLHIVHPLFIGVRNGVRAPDPVDNFDGYDLTIARGDTLPIGPGLLFLDGIEFTDQISLAFQLIQRWDPVVPPVGCKAVPGFTADAAPALAANCTRCHDGSDPMVGTSARNAVDMSHVKDMAPAGQAMSCAQVLYRTNPADPTASTIFVITAPTATGSHALRRFKFPDEASHQAFITQVSQWLMLEK